jgi:hypothetical protein
MFVVIYYSSYRKPIQKAKEKSLLFKLSSQKPELQIKMNLQKVQDRILRRFASAGGSHL